MVRRKEVRADGSIVEIVVWQMAEPLAPCKHHYKYRLAYVENGLCMLRYDNERGKGDHRHIDGVESDYRFVSLAQLLADSEMTWRTGNESNHRNQRTQQHFRRGNGRYRDWRE